MTQTHSEQTARGEATDLAYMLNAVVKMLGPKGQQVWKLWQERGLRRIHVSWGPDAISMTGEDVAELHLAFEDAPKTPIDDVDAHIAALSTTPDAVRGEVESNVGEYDRSVAQFFFEVGYGACWADAYVKNGGKAPFELTDAVVDRAWQIAPEAHEDHAEWDHYEALATLHPSPEAPIEGQKLSPDESDALHNALLDSVTITHRPVAVSAPIEGQDVEALRPFAAIADWWEGALLSDDYRIYHSISGGTGETIKLTLGDCRRARAALRAPIERKGEAIYEECARIAEDVPILSIGIMGNTRREHAALIATAIRNAAGEKG